MHVSVLAAPWRSRPTPRAFAGLLVGLFLLEVAAGVLPARAEPAGASEVSLHDDDGGAALFDSRGLHPGRVDSACVALSVSGSTDPADEVRLSTEVTNDDLAPFLLLTVERGSVARSGVCATFTGEPLWSGTLAEFPRSAASGIVTGWRPGLVDRETYRFSVTVLDDSRAQRRGAAATFVWTLDEAGAGATPEPAPTPTPEPTPTPTPAPEPAAPVLSPPTDPGTAAPSTTSAAPGSTSAAPAPAVDEPPVDGGDVVEAPPIPAGPSSIEEVVEHVAETALSVVRDGHFPAILVVVLLGFLLVQGAVDRRDPKLALAPLQQDLRVFRQFPEAPRTEGT